MVLLLLVWRVRACHAESPDPPLRDARDACIILRIENVVARRAAIPAAVSCGVRAAWMWSRPRREVCKKLFKFQVFDEFLFFWRRAESSPRSSSTPSSALMLFF